MPDARPLPQPLDRDPVFSVAAAKAIGVTVRRLRATDLEAPTSGVRRRAGTGPTELVPKAQAFALGLPPDVAFSHVTAARLWSLPVPTRWTPDEPLHVMRQTGRPPVERSGCTHHAGLETRAALQAPSGLSVVHPVQTWADLSTVCGTADLVAIGDALVARLPQLTPRHLVVAAAGRAGRRGSVALREAASLVRAGSASPWESKGRVLFSQWGLPEPDLNVDLWTETGIWLARPDFVWRERRVVGEYDGDQHRTDRRRWQYERERRAALEDEGWTYVEMTHLTLTSRPHRDALRHRLMALLVA